MVGALSCATTLPDYEAIPQDDYPTLEPDGATENTIDPETEAGGGAGAGAVTPSDPTGRQTPPNDPREWISIDTDLGDPRLITGMTVQLHISTPYRLPSGPNHLVVARPFELSNVSIRSAPGDEVLAEERSEALIATDAIDVDTPAIRNKSYGILDGATDDRERVDRLVAWVYENVSYVISTRELASDVLETREGDCSEKTMLFVALARAGGIPARRVVGLAFTYAGGGPAFGYHAWAEVELDGHWVPVDPTWNEPVADATHIKLLEGDGDSWGVVAGNIEIQILDVVRGAEPGEIDASRVAAELPAHLRLSPLDRAVGP
jgi:hypothetical protein